MNAITAAFYNRLSTDPGIGLLLVNEYLGAAPIFVRRPLPVDVVFPCIATPGNVSDIPDDAKNSRMRRILRDIYIYDRATNGINALERIAERTLELFHRAAFPVEGYSVIVSECEGPSVAPTDETLEGRIVQVQLLLSKG